MRRLMWFVIGFAAGLLPAAYLAWNHWFLVGGVFFLILGIGLLLVKAKTVRCAATVFLGIAVAAFWAWGFDSVYLSPAREIDGSKISSVIEVTDYSYDTTYGIAADGKIILEGKSYKVRAYLNAKEPLSPGDCVSGMFTLRLTTAGGQQDATYHQGKGIFLLAYADGEEKYTHVNVLPAKYFAAKLRVDILQTLDSVFPESTVGFIRALLLGNTTKLSYEEDTAFKVSGIRHVIAVSGLHVSILFALVYTVSGKHRVLTTVIGIPVLVLFAAVAGFTPSIVRACIMQVLMILAMLLNKEYDPPTALSFAVLSMLIINPMTITAVSFQLSVGCMIGIFLFCDKINEYFLKVLKCPKGVSLKSNLIRWICGSVSVTLSAMSITTPLSVAYFGMVSIIGLLTNLLCLWVISGIFYGSILACIAGIIWLPLGSVIAWCVSLPTQFVLYLSKKLSLVPFASVYTCSTYILLWVIFAYLMLGVFLLFRKKNPALLTICIVAGLVISLAASCIEPRLDSFRVTVFDVGQGQSILIQSQGKYYLVDCGGDRPEETADLVSQNLLSQGIQELDGLILTHYDTDHAGAVEYLLSRVSAQNLYLPDIEDDTDCKQRLSLAYKNDIVWVDTMTSYAGPWGSMTLVPGEGNENESCLCILFRIENCDILITGDRGISGERALINSIDLPELELLVAGHHGSASATGFELLSVTKPKNVVICVGEDNRYNHPAASLLERLEMFGCEVWRTDLHGTVVFGR